MTENTPRKQWTRVAAYSVIIRDGAILLCRLSSIDPSAGKWTLPGGGLDFGEKPEIGMQREVYEETGLKVTNYSLLTVDSNLYALPDSDMYAIQIYYRAEVDDAPVRFEVGGTTDICEWVPLDKIPDLPRVSIVDFALRLLES